MICMTESLGGSSLDFDQSPSDGQVRVRDIGSKYRKQILVGIIMMQYTSIGGCDHLHIRHLKRRDDHC